MFVCIYVHVDMCTCVQVSTETRGARCPGVEVADSCEASVVNAGNQTCVFWKNTLNC